MNKEAISMHEYLISKRDGNVSREAKQRVKIV